MDNLTGDVASLNPKDCYNGVETVVCIRISLLAVFTIITGICLIGRIVQYHYYKNKHYVQYFVMYTGLLIIFLLLINSVYFPQVQFDFTGVLLIAIQLLSIYLYYSFWAFRLLRKESLFLYGVLPTIVLLTFAFIGLFVWSMVSITDDHDECTRPQWLIFSTSQFIIVQLLLITVIYISCKLNHVKTVRINRWSQKAQLIFIVTVYEVVSVLMVIYDVYLIADGGRHCNSALSKNKNVLVLLEIFLKFLRFLVPQLAIIIIFAPLNSHRSNDPDDVIENNQKKYYYPPNTNTNGTDRDPLIYSIQPPSLKPSSPEEHYPSLPRYGTYSSTSGYNFYQFKSPSTSVN